MDLDTGAAQCVRGHVSYFEDVLLDASALLFSALPGTLQILNHSHAFILIMLKMWRGVHVHVC